MTGARGALVGVEKPARWGEKLESGGGGVGRVETASAGNGTAGPTDSLGCLDESAHWGVGSGVQFPFLEKGGLPTAQLQTAQKDP